MVPAPDPAPVALARGCGTELLLLRPGARADLARTLAHLDATGPALVLSPPREGGHDEEEWGAALANALAAPHTPLTALARPTEGEPDEAVAARAWPALERALAGGHRRILAVIAYDVARVSVACALGIPFERSRALRLDPGRVILLRDEPIGIVLRRSNVVSPRETTGTALPHGRSTPRPGADGAR